jgi:TIR domain
MSGQIFISYRRQESGWSARSLHARLCRDFDPNQIFMDLDAIALGEDFIEAIETTVARCDVLIAVIGHNWLTSKDEHGGRRLDNADDFVRMEIGTALKRRIRVIPVLVDGALMPRADDLPEDLKTLVRRNALAITGTSFEGDCQRLAGAIRQVLEKAAAEEREHLAAEQRQREEKQRLEAEVRQKEEKERLEAERLEKERLEAAQRENDRLEAERLQAEQREKERRAAEQREKERLEAKQLEQERLEAEKRWKEARQRWKEQHEAEQREKERLDAEQREKERLQAEQCQHDKKAQLEAQAAHGWAAGQLAGQFRVGAEKHLAGGRREKERLEDVGQTRLEVTERDPHLEATVKRSAILSDKNLRLLQKWSFVPFVLLLFAWLLPFKRYTRSVTYYDLWYALVHVQVPDIAPFACPSLVLFLHFMPYYRHKAVIEAFLSWTGLLTSVLINADTLLLAIRGLNILGLNAILTWSLLALGAAMKTVVAVQMGKLNKA